MTFSKILILRVKRNTNQTR